MTVKQRTSEVSRKTGETQIEIKLDVDGSGKYQIESGVPFLDHMLTLFAVHGFFNLTVQAKGDVEVDGHHTVEDIGICLGQAFTKALSDKSGIARYGACYLPMDETLVRVVVDLSNRPFTHYEVSVPDQKLGTFDTALAKEFMRSFSHHGGITLHVDLLHGENSHHIIEAVFKGLARAIRQAVEPLKNYDGVLSSKGSL